jgi:SPP1 family phage portal protein
MINSTIFTTDITGEEVTPELVARFIQRHVRQDLPHLQRLYAYYIGQQAILDRKKQEYLSNQQLVINHAAYIADFTSGYLMGTPVTYALPDNTNKIEPILDVLKAADAPTQDSDLALDAAIFGRAYEMIYLDTEMQIKLARLSPLNAFVVYDDTVEQMPVFGVHYYPVYTTDGDLDGYKGSFCTAEYTQQIRLSTGYGIIQVDEPVQHPFKKVPIDEIYNDGQRFGDFERVLSLIDAYNLLQSDRVNDKEQFVDALLVIKGQILGDTNAEKSEALEALKQTKVMELTNDADAAYLTRQFDESSVEVLKNSIVSDIHKISCVPDMSDEHFAGNTSGVAMKYKLLGLEQRTKVKQRFFTEGLRYRLDCIANALTVRGAAAFDLASVDISFRRSLPANELESAQLVSILQGIVPEKTLLSQLPFVSDVDETLKALEKDRQAAMVRQAQAQKALLAVESEIPIIKDNE